MTPSEFEQLKFIQQLFSDLTPVFFSIFILGVITGVFFFADLVNRLDRLSHRFRVPRRIKAFDEINQMYVYLYRFKGSYYGLAEFESKRKEVIASYKSFHKKDLSR